MESVNVSLKEEKQIIYRNRVEVKDNSICGTTINRYNLLLYNTLSVKIVTERDLRPQYVIYFSLRTAKLI